MELYVDIADLDAVKAAAEYFPIDGFTTNPKILTKAKKPVEEMMAEYRQYVRANNMKIFFQVTGETAEEMLEQAKALKEYFGERFIVKIPAVKEGYKAVRLCKEAGITVTVTVVHSMMQALVAAKAGADYVAPYVTHIDNIGADGIECVSEMVEVFINGGYPCKVLGASFRTVDQLKKLALAGCQAVTISPDLFDALIKHPSTDESMKGFETAWKETFGEKQISDLIPREK
ncbi:MAG: transaldolase family protein [Lachnospiraceae bacterium]|nr:transaldolase family protein [Lachnospiraceae bacterium]